jgi:hypothetical protein
MFPSNLARACKIAGQGVWEQCNYQPGYLGKNIGIMVGIIALSRLAAWVVLGCEEVMSVFRCLVLVVCRSDGRVMSSQSKMDRCCV